MQQPTSHYYLAIYGGAFDVASDDLKVIGRVQYLERPEFSNSGFADKDFGGFAMIGTALTKVAKTGGALFAYFGAGRMEGYVRAEEERRDDVPVAERRYAIPGPTAAVEYSYRWKSIDVAINHQTFIGYADRAQTDAYVAWPFNFFQATVGVLW